MKRCFNVIQGLLFLLTIPAAGHKAGAAPGIPVSCIAVMERADSAVDPWVFKARQALPQSGRSRILTSEYLVKYSPGKLVVALPYFGRAYAGAGYGMENVLDFTSTDFSYTEETGRKNRRNITIKPKDHSEVQSLSFTFYPNGSARLSVVLTNRSAISFQGDHSALSP
jgi:hypothetical protein